MSNSDSLSFAANTLTRGGFVDSGTGKPSLTTQGAADHIADHGWSLAGQPATVTYAYRASGTSPDSDSTGFSPFSTAQIAAAEKALASWSDVANISFTRVNDGSGYSNNATILFGNFTTGSAAGFTYLPGSRSPAAIAGDVWINGSESYNQAPTIGNYGGQVLPHEIGHAIGMEHPGAYDASDAQEPTYEANAKYYEDSRQYTIMSYFGSFNTGAYLTAYSAVPLVDDITSAQRLYGANMTTRTGDTTYGFHSNAGRDWFAATSASADLIFSVWDAGGNDTFDFSGYAQNQVIDLRPGDFSDVGAFKHNVSIAYGATIENAIGGTGADTIIGNVAANVLDGGSGNDALYGESGNDTLRGGAGDDLLDGGSGSNVIDGATGSDTVLLPGSISDYYSKTIAGGSYTISGNTIVDTVSNVEFVRLQAIGATSGTTYSLSEFLTGLANAPFASAPYRYADLTDFNGDRHSDILWRNQNGAVSTWQASGSPVGSGLQPGVFNTTVGTDWKALETFDMNGDGQSDILWRNVNGTIAVWSNVSDKSNASSYVDRSVGNDWSIAAVGDFDGDGKDDLLWRHQGGALSIWSSTGGGFDAGSYNHAPVGTTWRIEGATDFNGDGHADIFWRDGQGNVTSWIKTAAGFAEGAFNYGVGLDWHVNGLADFNGDGRDDVLWRNDNGALTIWYSNDMSFNQGQYNHLPVGNSWHVAEVGDFNGDDKADLLWRNDNGSVTEWQSTGFGFAEGLANNYASTDWSIVAHVFPL